MLKKEIREALSNCQTEDLVKLLDELVKMKAVNDSGLEHITKKLKPEFEYDENVNLSSENILYLNDLAAKAVKAGGKFYIRHYTIHDEYEFITPNPGVKHRGIDAKEMEKYLDTVIAKG